MDFAAAMPLAGTLGITIHARMPQISAQWLRQT